MKSVNIFAHFHDIITPPPVSMMPQTIGYLLLVFLLLSMLFPFALYLRKRYLRNIYRGQAIEELRRIEKIADPYQQLRELLELLKRTAISAYTRAAVADLGGSSWWRFLQEKSGITLDRQLQEYCENIYLDETALTPANNRQVAAYVRRWIRRHKGVAID